MPVLAYPDFLCTDASYIGLGAVLEQCQDCEQRPQPIQYASASLTSAQKNYAITDLECLAVVWAIHKFKHYLTVMPFKLVTNHGALNYILHNRGNHLTGRLARWNILLQGMAYEVVYGKGTDNKVPDCLSRNPSPPEVEPPYDESVERFSFLSAVEPDLSNPVDWKRAQCDDAFCTELIAYLAAKQKTSAILNPKFAASYVELPTNMWWTMAYYIDSW